MADRKEIEEIIIKIKRQRNRWRLSNRRKNQSIFSVLGTTDVEEIFNMIYENISWRNYSSGPLQDNHPIPVPGDIWVFGLRLYNLDCYLKFQDKPDGTIMWISIHEQEYHLDLPYLECG